MKLATARERLDYQGALLGLVVLVTCALLALAYQLTREPIRLALETDMRNNFAQVLPSALYDNDLINTRGEAESPWGNIIFYQAIKEGRVTAVVFPLFSEGYAGKIQMLMAVKANGEVGGVRVLVHQETPGLGDKIEVSRHPWITGFTGKSLTDPQPERWSVKKDGGVFDQFTGATITPRAIVGGVYKGLVFFEQHKETLLYPLPTVTSED